ncbi:hypothetical protein L7F22_033556 [Adiantum nelumboides]|nr:hypothetical protein [Adiantum nelumboides]
MVEFFCKNHLGADKVLGSKIQVTKGGRATGLLLSPGVLLGDHKRHAVKAEFGDQALDVGLDDRDSDHPFLHLCKNLQRNADEEEKQLHIKLLALHGLDAASLLRHIVLIKDGNNRWVQWEIMLPEQGYEAGVNAWQYRNVQLSARSCVSILTAFCFSTKNRRRPQT